MAATTKTIVTVLYWVGTTQYSGTATTYRGAMRLASRNRNAYSPRFRDANGETLHDDGNGLCYEEPDAAGRTVYAV